MTSGAPLYIWTVYENPTDYPKQFVVRRFRVASGGILEADERPWSIKDTIEKARGTIPPGLFRARRERGDDPKIRESWI